MWPDSAVAAVAILGLLLFCALIAVIWALANVQRLAEARLENWKRRDVEMIRDAESRAAHERAMAVFEHWKLEHEAAIREDAISRSQATIIGKVTEHLVPFFSDFPFNPRDARFVGSPIDLLVFDGLNDGFVREIIFAEVKTGDSRLTLRERQIRDAIAAGKVVWRELRI